MVIPYSAPALKIKRRLEKPSQVFREAFMHKFPTPLFFQVTFTALLEMTARCNNATKACIVERRNFSRLRHQADWRNEEKV